MILKRVTPVSWPSRHGLAVVPAPLATYLDDKADPSIWKAGQ
jgi:hypothetical protein